MIKKLLMGGGFLVGRRRSAALPSSNHPLQQMAGRLGRQVVRAHGVHAAAGDYLPPQYRLMRPHELRHLLMLSATGVMSARSTGLASVANVSTDILAKHLLDSFDELDTMQQVRSGRLLAFRDLHMTHDAATVTALNTIFSEAYDKLARESHGTNAA